MGTDARRDHAAAKNTHILNASSNLLGLGLLLITGLHVTGYAERTVADEIACIATVSLSASCLLSYAAIRSESAPTRLEHWADRTFIVGLLCLVIAVLLFAVFNV